MSGEWKKGLPPGEADTDKYEVYFSPGGWTWYREREPQETSAKEQD